MSSIFHHMNQFLTDDVINEGKLSMQERGPMDFTSNSKKHFVAQWTIQLNILWPSNLFEKKYQSPSH